MKRREEVDEKPAVVVPVRRLASATIPTTPNDINLPRRVLVALILASLFAEVRCGGGGVPFLPLPPQECATLSTQSWRIGPFAYSPGTEQLPVMVGQSRRMFLEPSVESQCANSIASVTWTVENPTVASIIPEVPAYRGSWVTGVMPAATAVRVRIVFSGGLAQEPPPRAIQVVAPDAPSPGSLLITQGSVESIPAVSAKFVPFSLPQDASVIDVTIDWDSPLDRANFALFEGGDCGATTCPGRIIPTGPEDSYVKPLREQGFNLSAGAYTLRLNNWGPGLETIRYEVRMTRR